MLVDRVKKYFMDLQETICGSLEEIDGSAAFLRTHNAHERGLSKPQVLSGGQHIEKAAVHFTHIFGETLPKAATERKSELAGCSFQAASISLIVHPRNPFAPTTHANLRYFVAKAPDGRLIWWFGGGFDLTPYYGFVEDAKHWHQIARKAVSPFGKDIYPQFKANCDAYFYLPHRNETRGIGGLFFEDYNTGDQEQDFLLVQSIGSHFLEAYLPIFKRRYQMPYGEDERNHQLCRRGRYVEFNLLYDRGTKYGLQSGRNIESVMASMPPNVKWEYNRQPVENSPEDILVSYYLRPQNWIAE